MSGEGGPRAPGTLSRLLQGPRGKARPGLGRSPGRAAGGWGGGVPPGVVRLSGRPTAGGEEERVRVWGWGARGMQTVERQHGRKVLAVGDARGVRDARLPQVGPIGSGGDDRAVDGGHLPVVGGQRGGHQHPAGDGDHEGNDLRRRARHAARCRRARSRAPHSAAAQRPPHARPRGSAPVAPPTRGPGARGRAWTRDAPSGSRNCSRGAATRVPLQPAGPTRPCASLRLPTPCSPSRGRGAVERGSPVEQIGSRMWTICCIHPLSPPRLYPLAVAWRSEYLVKAEQKKKKRKAFDARNRHGLLTQPLAR